MIGNNNNTIGLISILFGVGILAFVLSENQPKTAAKKALREPKKEEKSTNYVEVEL